MKDISVLFAHLVTVIIRLVKPGGGKSIFTENLLLKQQLLVIARSRQRAPNLLAPDRLLLGFWSLFLYPGRIARVGYCQLLKS